MNKLQQLIIQSKVGVSIFINEHRLNYQSVEEFFEDPRSLHLDFTINPFIEKTMKKGGWCRFSDHEAALEKVNNDCRNLINVNINQAALVKNMEHQNTEMFVTLRDIRNRLYNAQLEELQVKVPVGIAASEKLANDLINKINKEK